MAINKKLIHFLKKENFENEVANGNILDNSIVFIKDTKEIWTHGTYYGSDVEVLNLTIDEEELEEVLNKGGSIRIDTVTLEDFTRLHNSKFSIALVNEMALPLTTKLDDELCYLINQCVLGVICTADISLRKYDDVVLADFNVILEPIQQIPGIEFNIRDIQDIQSIKSFSTHTNAIYYYRIGGNDTVYLDTEDILLSLFLNGNDGAVETLYKTKEAYYKIGETWYSQNLSNYINFPKLHLKTCKGGDLISVTKHEVLASEFYSRFIDFNSISLNLDTLLRAGFEAFKISEGQKNLSDGEFIKYLIRNNKIYSAMRDPNLGESVYPLAIDGFVTYYEFHIIPNTENMYNGKFWTGNMTGPGIYSYVNAGLPEDTDEGEYYIGYVSPDGALSLISMKNPNKVFTRPDINSTWVKLENSNTFPSRSGWLLNVDNCLDSGVYPTCDTASLGLGWLNQYTTIVVHRTSTEDNGGYHTIEQTAYGRGSDEGRISRRIIFYKSDGTDTQYRPWNTITFGVSTGNNSTALGYGATAKGTDSIALGNGAFAGGSDSSIALGNGAVAGGIKSTALGYGAIASGSDSSISLGNGAVAGAIKSTALGNKAKASGFSSTALGNGATASGSDSIALGTNVEATADYSIALGMHNNPHFTENNDSATSLFTLGKGIYIKGNSSLFINRANALEIMKNNDIWFGEYNTGLKVYDGATNTTPFIEKKVGETSKVVLGDGTLKSLSEISGSGGEIPLATSTNPGLMSKEDKIKSDLFEYSIEENSLDCNAKINPIGVEVNHSSETLESKLQLTKSEFIGTEDLCLDITSTNTISELPAPIVGRIAVSPGTIGSTRYFSFDDGEIKEEVYSQLFIDNALSLDEGGVYSKITNKVGYESTIENHTACVDIDSDQYSSSLSIFHELKNHNTGEYSKKEFLVNTTNYDAGIRLWNHKENTSSGIQFSVDNDFLEPEIHLVKDGQAEVLINSTGITAPKFIKTGGTATQVLMADGNVKEISEIGGEDDRFTQLLNLLSFSNYCIPDEGVVAGEYVWDDGSNNEEGIARLTFTPDGESKMLTYSDEFGWTEQTSAWSIPNIPVATTTSGGVMSPEDKQALEELKQQMSNINLILESIIGNGVNDTLESIINS